MKKIILIVIILVLTGATFWYYTGKEKVAANPYRFVTIEQGDLESVVSATGNLGAVTTVQVGTQVSGIVEKIYVDFNDRVRRGQLIARIDTTLLISSIQDARANLERNQAQLGYSQSEYKRIEGLHTKGYATDVELNKAKYDVDIAVATTKSSEVNLERAERNLGYATIYSPISGIVIERNVDVGQTVAASLSAPQLFLIANDLSQLQILASVDESDIGLIKEGQQARFTVQAYDDETFVGTVRQVRLQSSTQENVVNYTVVVDVANPDGKLLPGMTATVDFLIERVMDVLKIPNAALRFRPTESMMAALQAQRESRMATMPDSAREQMASRQGRPGGTGSQNGGASATRTGGQGGFSGAFGGGGSSSDRAMLWYFDENGQLAMTPVRKGLSDGQFTEIRPMRDGNLAAGLQVIVGVTEVAGAEGPASPFQTQQQGGGRFRGGF